MAKESYNESNGDVPLEIFEKLAPDDPDGSENEEHEPKKSLSYKIIYTIFIYTAFLIYGIGAGLPGACLMDLSILTAQKVESITKIFIFLNCGLLMGFLSGGYFYSLFNRNLIMCTSSLFIGSLLIVQVPYCRTLSLLCGVNAVLGIAYGFFSLGCATACTELWNKKRGQILQGLYLTVTLGCFVSPQLASPFLYVQSPDNNQSLANNSGEFIYNSSFTEDSKENSSISYSEIVYSDADRESLQIIYPYAIVGVMFFLVSGGNFAFCLFGGCSLFHINKEQTIIVRNCNAIINHYSELKVFMLFVMSNFLFGAYEDIPAIIIPIFITKYFSKSKQSAAQLQSLFWVGISAGRFLGALLANRLKPACIQIINVVSTLAFVLALYVFLDYYILVWVFTIATGIFSGSTVATNLSWISTEMVLTNWKCSLMLAFLNVSKMFTSYAVTNLIHNYDLNWYIYSQIIILSLLAVIVFSKKVYITSINKSERTETNVVINDSMQRTMSQLSIAL